MKNRIFLMMIAALLIVCITACGARTENEGTADAGTGNVDEETTTNPMVAKTPSISSSNIDEGFIITPTDVHVKPGESVEVKIMLENKSHRKVERFEVRVTNENIPIGGAIIWVEDTRCYAVSSYREFYPIGDTWRCDTLDSGKPQEIDTDKAVFQFSIRMSEYAEPGEYEWKLDRFHVVESSYDGLEFDAYINPGKIVVEVDESKPSSNVDEGFIITPADVHVKPGETVEVEIMLENKSHRKVKQFGVIVTNENIPIRGATVTMNDTHCYALGKEFYLIGDTWYCEAGQSVYPYHPDEIDTNEAVCQFSITIPADARPGTYEWKIDRFHVVEDIIDGIEFDANIKPGKIIVEADD